METKLKEISRADLKCPICGTPANWIKNVGDFTFNGGISLLAECWSGDIDEEEPRHLFLIRLNNLPELDLREEEPEQE